MYQTQNQALPSHLCGLAPQHATTYLLQHSCLNPSLSVCLIYYARRFARTLPAYSTLAGLLHQQQPSTLFTKSATQTQHLTVLRLQAITLSCTLPPAQSRPSSVASRDAAATAHP